MALGLLRVPRMAEIKHASVALRHFTPSPVDPDTVKVHLALFKHCLLEECSRSASLLTAQGSLRSTVAERRRLPSCTGPTAND